MKTSTKIYKYPVLLIGAPRSGTKMLREVLKFHPSIIGSSFEAERVWKYGNMAKYSSVLTESDVTGKIKRHIRSHFYKKARCNSGKIIIDKNVHNCLRFGFIREVFPESKIIHIARDGRDAVCSIRQRWNAPLDLKYIIKNRSFPLKELPFFIKRQAKFYYEKLTSGNRYVKWWGPKFDDSKKLIQTKSLLEICCIQWKRCIGAVLDKKSELDLQQYYEVRYEDIIKDPVVQVRRILKFLGLSSNIELDRKFREYVISASIGRWKKELTREESEMLLEYIGKYLQILGYIK